MKKIYILALLSILSLPCLAQFRLSGTILHQTRPDTFYVNIPYVFGHTYLSKVPVITNAAGGFNTLINLTERRFAYLIGNGLKTTLLLKPGGALNITINLADSSVTTFKGSTAAENQLLYQLKMDKPAFFWGNGHGNKSLQTLLAAEVPEKVYQPLLAQRDARLKLISAAKISVGDKKLITQEVRAQAVNDMSDYTRAFWKLSSRSDFNNLIETIFKDNAPKPEISPAGPRFYAFADQYIAYLEVQSMSAFQKLPMAARATAPLKYYGLTIDSGKRVAKEKGKLYLNWLAVKNGIDKLVAEPLLAQYIFDKCDEKVLFEASALLNEMKLNFPNSAYLPGLITRVGNLNTNLAQNSNNNQIKIIEGYKEISSIYQVVNQLKGKVVYLDIWGTWCGPCKDELKFNPQLKEYFKGKDVAFVYLDMDDDEKDGKWREFLKVNGLTGWHLRKNRDDIKQFWAELLADKSKQNLYPTYFIFDKNGKLVQAEAKRPSNQTQLYQQIEKYL